MKKCPACNSSRYKNIEGEMKCARCGFINKSIDKINEQLDSQLTTF